MHPMTLNAGRPLSRNVIGKGSSGRKRIAAASEERRATAPLSPTADDPGTPPRTAQSNPDGRRSAAAMESRPGDLRFSCMTVVGGVASYLLAGGCFQTMDPQLATLVVSGRVDMFSATVCRLSIEPDRIPEEGGSAADGPSRGNRRIIPSPGAEEARADASSDASVNRLRTTLPASDPMVEFLGTEASVEADEASCLASTSGGQNGVENASNIIREPLSARPRGSRPRNKRSDTFGPDL